MTGAPPTEQRSLVSDARFIFAVPLTAAFAVAGCKAQPHEPSASPASRPTAQGTDSTPWEEKALPLEQSSVAVKQGPTPLAVIFDVAAPIRVVDMTTGQRLLSIDVPARALVRVDDRHGVTVGSENVYPGPLPAGHQYGIYADPTTPNTYRRGYGPLREAPQH